MAISVGAVPHTLCSGDHPRQAFDPLALLRLQILTLRWKVAAGMTRCIKAAASGDEP